MRREFNDDAPLPPHGAAPALQSFRTGYRCHANGCPNAGPIGGRFGADNSGFCYHHYVERESPGRWAEITERIKADFEGMRNFGTPRNANHREWRDTPQQAEMRKAKKPKTGGQFDASLLAVAERRAG